MKKLISFSITFLFALAVQFYVVELKPAVAQLNNNASEEFFEESNEQMKEETENLESERNRANEDEIERDRTEGDELNTEEQNSTEGLNRQDLEVDRELEKEAESFR